MARRLFSALNHFADHLDILFKILFYSDSDKRWIVKTKG